MNRVYRFLIILTLTSVSVLYALDPQRTIHQYVHRKWTSDNGLPGHTVTSILQTRDGVLWIATVSGLFRFDGITFTEIETNPLSPKSHEWITALCEASDGTLWIGTAFKGLRFLKNGKIRTYGLKEGFEDTQVWSIAEGRDSTMYVATSIGLYRVRRYQALKIFDKPNYISSVVLDGNERVYLGTHQGVYVLRGSQIIEHFSTENGLPNNAITALLIDEEGALWIGTANGLVRYHEKKIKVFTTEDGLSGNFITDVLKDRDRNVWVGTQRGLSRYSNGKWESFRQNDGLTNDNIHALVEDREGTLWIGTSDGINQLYDGTAVTFTMNEGLANNHVSSIVDVADGSLFFFSPEGTSITRLSHGKRTVYPTSVGPVYVAKDGSIWMGQSGFLLNIRKDRMIQYTTEHGIPNRWISAIVEDTVSLILYVDHVGLFRFIRGSLVPYILNNGTKYPADEYVVCFFFQRNGTLWIGAANGLVQIRNNELRWFYQKDGLAGNWVSSLTEDTLGSLWIASPQGGITRYRNGQFKPFRTRDGLIIDEVYSIVCDDYNNLWMGTPRGIQCLRVADVEMYEKGEKPRLEPRLFTISDGLKSNECFGAWQPAAWKARTGDLWFATRKGAVKITPTTIKRNTYIPPVRIETIIGDRQHYPVVDGIRLPAGTNAVEIYYAAFSYLMPEKVTFQYKLQGYSNEWIDVGNRRVAYFTNLPPGRYQFYVRARNNDGIWSENVATVIFEIEPHYYQTWWFITLIVLSILGMIAGMVYYRIWQHKKYERELEARVNEALANIKVLSGLIPICANCKKIRDDSGYWAQLEAYLQSHSEATFSHGICPECAEKLYPSYKHGKSSESTSTNQ